MGKVWLWKGKSDDARDFLTHAPEWGRGVGSRAHGEEEGAFAAKCGEIKPSHSGSNFPSSPWSGRKDPSGKHEDGRRDCWRVEAWGEDMNRHPGNREGTEEESVSPRTPGRTTVRLKWPALDLKWDQRVKWKPPELTAATWGKTDTLHNERHRRNKTNLSTFKVFTTYLNLS